MISPITATFVQSEFATHYTISITAHGADANRALDVSWSLKLECIDPGCPNPNGTAGAPQPNVDPGCDNNGVGTNSSDRQQITPSSGQMPEFIWHHPSAQDDPTGTYHCNHAKEGPRGHQGLITVQVTDGTTACTATYKGTNSSTSTSVQDGTASKPICKEPLTVQKTILHGDLLNPQRHEYDSDTPVAFEITVTNPNDFAVWDVSISDQGFGPGGTSASSDYANVTVPPGCKRGQIFLFTCSKVTIPAHGTHTIHVSVKYSPNATGAWKNTAGAYGGLSPAGKVPMGSGHVNFRVGHHQTG